MNKPGECVILERYIALMGYTQNRQIIQRPMATKSAGNCPGIKTPLQGPRSINYISTKIALRRYNF